MLKKSWDLGANFVYVLGILMGLLISLFIGFYNEILPLVYLKSLG